MRKFVEGIFSLSALLTKLNQEVTKFHRTATNEWCSQELKYRLTSTLILTLPERLKGYTMYCASFKHSTDLYFCSTRKGNCLYF
ncbi:hypothetical protein MTR67_034840 [Solanum verrucosum]|uniref:Uncharacterized protein n=1 Tax=Solanum verrucosum TaxID=315347 RepID=A0AAF0U8T9_SOLVR|nr:hypothetical protein MTR67_034840 [Solanum verrucosum]